MRDPFNMVESYRNLQTQQLVPPPPPPPPPQLTQLPAVQLQPQQSGFMCPLSTPPVVSPPSFYQQMTHTQPWQSGTEIQPHQGWPTFGPNLSGLNTLGLSGFLNQASQTSGPPMPGTRSTLTIPEARPVSRCTNTSDVLRSVHQAIDPDQDQE